MRPTARLGFVAALALTLTAPMTAQTREGVMGDLLRDINQVEQKIVGLAKAMPAETYDWRPGAGVRSTSETLMHVAADNYFLPAMMGTAAPPETGISGKDFKTTTTFEKRTVTRDQVIAELEKSFAFLKTSMAAMPDSQLETPVPAGPKMTNRSMWIATATHLHEHLGQLIAYARSNKVTPPWSK